MLFSIDRENLAHVLARLSPEDRARARCAAKGFNKATPMESVWLQELEQRFPQAPPAAGAAEARFGELQRQSHATVAQLRNADSPSRALRILDAETGRLATTDALAAASLGARSLRESRSSSPVAAHMMATRVQAAIAHSAAPLAARRNATLSLQGAIASSLGHTQQEAPEVRERGAPAPRAGGRMARMTRGEEPSPTSDRAPAAEDSSPRDVSR